MEVGTRKKCGWCGGTIEFGHLFEVKAGKAKSGRNVTVNDVGQCDTCGCLAYTEHFRLSRHAGEQS
jgi:hypothetical protein